MHRMLPALPMERILPALPMESPRGANDPSLGGVRTIFPRADLVVLLGRRADFSLGFGRPPLFSAEVRFVTVGPDVARADPGRLSAGRRPAISRPGLSRGLRPRWLGWPGRRC